MNLLDEIVAYLKAELLNNDEQFGMRKIEEMIYEKFGRGDDVHAVLQSIVKSFANRAMDIFDQLPPEIRERLAKSDYELDAKALLDHYSQSGEVATIALIPSMERIADRLLRSAYWKDLGLTPMAQFKKRPQSYAETVQAKWKAGIEAARRQNAARKDGTETK